MTALYRKRRPKTFRDNELIGQPHIARVLINQLMSGQMSHAYLFCGTRGTGKTSVAKILARAVNCYNPQEGNPCNECEMCKNILAERSFDVVEIDAASNNGVENIRDLREEVKYPPSQGKYKVYIVDEVHMLTTNAFNALLKTLEEPPAFVIFILATTDPQKIPATILSRCQRYDFRRISATDMIKSLKSCLVEQNITFEESALDYITYHSDGAMRDALSLLDQCLSLSDGSDGLTYEKVLEMLGAVDRGKLFELTDALVNNDSMAVMSIITKAMDDGRDVSQFVADLIRHFRDVLVASLGDGGEFSAQIVIKLKEQGQQIPASRLLEFINVFSETLREMRFAPHARTAFEVAALRLCMPQQQAVNPLPTPEIQSLPTLPKPQKKEQSKTPSKNNSNQNNTLQTICNSWVEIYKSFRGKNAAFLSKCEMHVDDGQLKIHCPDSITRDSVEKQKNTIREIIEDKFATSPTITFIVKEGLRVTPSPPPKPKVAPTPPAPMPMFSPIEEPQGEINIPADWAEQESLIMTESTDDDEVPF